MRMSEVIFFIICLPNKENSARILTEIHLFHYIPARRASFVSEQRTAA